MNRTKLFGITALWFSHEAAIKAEDGAWYTSWEVAQGASWEVLEAKRISHMKASLAILYRKKWGQ